jgi:hypothetical protein
MLSLKGNAMRCEEEKRKAGSKEDVMNVIARC